MILLKLFILHVLLPLFQCITIIMMGDSTCSRQSNSFTRLHNCHIISRENSGGKMPDLNYWSRNNSILNIQTHYRDCSGCNSYRAKCNFGHFEYITMEFLHDTELTTRRNAWEKSCNNNPDYTRFCSQSSTTQEFLFNEYLHICPDIIYHVSTGVHDIARYKPHQFKRNAVWFYALIDEFHVRCPNTLYYWGTSGRISEALVPERFKNWTTNEV